MSADLRIDPEFRLLCPRLVSEELAGLRTSIETHGVRDPLVVWREERVLLDGHNRFDICRDAGIPFATVEYGFPDRAAARNWVIDNQLSRRNLSATQAAYLRGKRYNAEKKEVGRPSGQLGNACPVSTAERLAPSLGVSPRTLKNDGAFADAVDKVGAVAGEEAKREILSGDTDLSHREVVAAAAGMTTVGGRRRPRAPKGPALAVVPCSADTMDALLDLLRGDPTAVVTVGVLRKRLGASPRTAVESILAAFAAGAGVELLRSARGSIRGFRLRPPPVDGAENRP